MTNLINLNKFRKNRARQDEKQTANENSVKFGQSKAERILQATRDKRAVKLLDQHELDEDQ